MTSLPAYDYIIVGGGSAGCVLAARLTEDKDVSVLLLESGGGDRHPLFHIPAGFAKMTKGMASWGYETVPQAHMGGRKLWFTQARVIGGGSTINAQIYVRGNRRDYDAWDVPGWGYADVLPYFRRAEDNERLRDSYHGQGGPLGVSDPRGALPITDAFIAAAEAYGMPRNPDFNGAEQAGVGHYQLTQRDARRSSTARDYLRPVMKRSNLSVVLNATVTGLTIENGVVRGVNYVGTSGAVQAACNRDVILSAGAIGTPTLLMRAGIGPADHLLKVGIDVVLDHPSIGSNLRDHIDLCTIWECTGPHTYDGTERLDRTVLAGLRYFLSRAGPAVSPLFETGGFWYSGEPDGWPDVQFHLGQGSGIEKGIVRIDGAGVTLNSANMRPKSRGTVRLSGADPSVPPLIDPNYWAEPEDLDVTLRGLAMAREIMAQSPLGDFVGREVLPGPDVRDHAARVAYAQRMAKTDHHPVGTCRMGTDAGAVVDPSLRVNGMRGLRIVDASIMPNITSGNTNAATIMIAEKAADLIRDMV